MTVEIGIIFSLIACIIGVAGFIVGQKKSSKDDGLSLGEFMRWNKNWNSKHKRHDKRA